MARRVDPPREEEKVRGVARKNPMNTGQKKGPLYVSLYSGGGGDWSVDGERAGARRGAKPGDCKKSSLLPMKRALWACRFQKGREREADSTDRRTGFKKRCQGTLVLYRTLKKGYPGGNERREAIQKGEGGIALN